MRRLLLLAGAAVFLWRVLRDRGGGPREQVVVGFEDGSALVLDAEALARKRLVAIARDAVAR